MELPERNAHYNHTNDSGQSNDEIIYLLDKTLVKPSDDGQVRLEPDDESIEELARNIAANGQLQPIIVEPENGTDNYIIVAGERRWRAISTLDNIPTIKAIVCEFENDKKRLMAQLSENLDRKDLSIYERALAAQKIVDLYDNDYQAAADALGKSRPTLLKMLDVLDIPEPGKSFVLEGGTSDYTAVSLLKKLFKVDEKAAQEVVEDYQTGQDLPPLRDTLKEKLETTKKTKGKKKTRPKIVAATDIFIKPEDTNKIYIQTARSLLTIKLDNVSRDTLAKILLEFNKSNEQVAGEYAENN